MVRITNRISFDVMLSLNICPCLSTIGHSAVTVEEPANGMLLQYLWIWLSF